MTYGGRKKPHKHRLWGERPAGQLGMALGREEEWVLIQRKLQHLHDGAVRMTAGKDEPLGLESFDMGGLNFVTVTEPLTDDILSKQPMSQRAGCHAWMPACQPRCLLPGQ